MNVLVCSPATYQLEAPEVGEYLASVYLWAHQHKVEIAKSGVRKGRIHQIRNAAVEQAQQLGFDRILFIDPDMVVDRYLAAGQEPFLPTAMRHLDGHPGSVAAAPYCGPWPERTIRVFGIDPENGKLFHCSHGFSQWREGWHQVAAVGTGLMLIDVCLFSDLEPPYFEDQYRTRNQIAMKHSQDVTFCKRVRDAGHEIWVNFSSWCGHYQNSIVDPPGLEGQRDGEINLNAQRTTERWDGSKGATLPGDNIPGKTSPGEVVQET